MLNVFFLQFCPLIKYSQRYLFLCKLRKLNNHFSPDPSSSTCDQIMMAFEKWLIGQIVTWWIGHVVNWHKVIGKLAIWPKGQYDNWLIGKLVIFTSSKRSFSSSSVGRNPIALQIKSKVFDKESIIVDFSVSSRTSWYHRGHRQRGSLVSSHQRGWNTPCYWLDGEQVQNCTPSAITTTTTTINILNINTIVIKNVGTHLEALDLVHGKPGLLVDLCKI